MFRKQLLYDNRTKEYKIRLPLYLRVLLCTLLVNFPINSCTAFSPQSRMQLKNAVDGCLTLASKGCLNNKKFSISGRKLFGVTQTSEVVSNNLGYRFTRRNIPSDNSCLFTSFAYLAEGPRMNKDSSTRRQAASALRSLCADTIMNNPDDWPDWKIGRSVVEYTNNLLDPDSWGGEIEIVILTNHFGVPVWVASMTPGNVLKYEPQTYQGPKDKGWLLFYTGEHYDPIVGIESANAPFENDILVSDLNSETERLLVELCKRERHAYERRQEQREREIQVKKIKCLDCGALLDTNTDFKEHCMDPSIPHSDDFCFKCEEVLVTMTHDEVARHSKVDFRSPNVYTFYDIDAMPLANCYPSTINIYGMYFSSVYQYLLWVQFDTKTLEGKKMADLILKAESLDELRRFENVVGTNHPGLREGWGEEMKERATLVAMRAKFTQDSEAAEELASTKNKEIVMVGADTWGGMSTARGLPEGKNIYGKALMMIRDELKQLEQ